MAKTLLTVQILSTIIIVYYCHFQIQYYCNIVHQILIISSVNNCFLILTFKGNIPHIIINFVVVDSIFVVVDSIFVK